MKKIWIAVFTMFLIWGSAAYAAAPLNVTVQPASGKVTIAWKNPSVSITEIDIVNKNGVSVAGDTTLSKTAGAVNVVAISGLTDNTEYKFTIKITSGGSTEDTVVTAKPVNLSTETYTADGYNIPKWIWRGGGSSIIRVVDTEEKHEGNASLKIISNFRDAYVQTTADAVSLDKNKEYRVYFWARVKNAANNKVQYMNDWGTRYTIAGDTWKEYTLDLKDTTSLIFRFIVETTCDALWIDDIQLYEIADGQPTGGNLFPQGNFEYTPYNFNLDGTTLSWTEPQNASYSGVDIYQETIDGMRVKLNSTMIAAGVTTYTLPAGLLADESYDLVFVSFFGKTAMPDVRYSVLGKIDYFDTVLSNNNGPLPGLTSGEVTVTKPVRNNAMGSDIRVSLILALYKDDVLTGMNFIEKTIPENGQKTDVSTQITVPDDGGHYELQVFLWSDLEEMEILKEFTSFKN